MASVLPLEVITPCRLSAYLHCLALPDIVSLPSLSCPARRQHHCTAVSLAIDPTPHGLCKLVQRLQKAGSHPFQETSLN